MITRLTVQFPALKCLPIAVGLSLVAQSMPLSVEALSTATKKMSLPTNSKMDAGSGPDSQNQSSDGTAAGNGAAADAKTVTAASDNGEPVTAASGSDQTTPAAQTAAAGDSASPSAPATSSATQAAASDQGAAASASAASQPASASQEASSETKTGSGDAQGKTAAGDKVLNVRVDKNEFVPKEPVDRTDTVAGEEPKKTRKSKAEKKEAFDKKVHDTGMKLGPIQLQDQDDEQNTKVSTVFDAEKGELAEIWDAALCRNQDIQFVVQKLMPTKDPRHTTAIMMKMLSTAMYGAMAAGGMVMGSAGNTSMYMAQSAGGSLVMSVLNGANTRQQKKAALTETEAIMLYNMIRGVANQVVDNFHSYRKYLGSVNRAWTDYQDLQAMVNEARAGQDSPRQIECEYMLRKARRDIDSLNEDVRRSRQALVDLSGTDAVDRLDKQIAIEAQTVAGKPEASPPDNGKPAEEGHGNGADKGAGSKTAQSPGADL